jgi:hypothetical protein
MLTKAKPATIPDTDIVRCMQYCDVNYHLYFGIHNGTDCYCAKSLARGALNVSADSFCRKSCPVDDRSSGDASRLPCGDEVGCVCRWSFSKRRVALTGHQ